MDKRSYRLIGLISGLIFASTVFGWSSKNLNRDIKRASPWSVTASIGYTNFNNMSGNDGQTPVGRLAFDKGIINIKYLDIGGELAVQNGNNMRLNVPQADLDILGGSPVQTEVNPIIDLLATATTKPLAGSPIFGQIKGGIAYRCWQFEGTTSINPVSNIAGEVQAGLGMMLSKMTKLSLLYQGIYGGNSNFVINASNETEHVSTIPIQNGVLLSMNVVV